jgi:ankyrin repeat protein
LVSNPLEHHVEIFLELIAQGDVEEAEHILLQHHLDVNTRDENGEYATALHVAAQNDDIEAIRMLLRHSADKTVAMSNGMTPLQVAQAVGATDAACALAE